MHPPDTPIKETIEKLAVIPAKGTSVRFPCKNVRPLRHVPLFLYSVAYALQEGFTPVVATDSEWVEAICRMQKIVKIRTLGVSHCPMIRVVREVVDDSKLENCVMQVLEQYDAKQVALLQPSSPIREPGLLSRMSFEMSQEGFESAFTYKPVKMQGIYRKEWNEAPIAQQEQDWLMAFTGNIALFSPEKLVADGSFYDDSSRGYFSEPPTDLQVDTATDFEVIETLMASPSFRSEYVPNTVMRKIAVVSNGPVRRNYSEFIDSCDLVVRVNKMEEMSSGKLGTKTDILVVSLYGSAYPFFSEHPEKLREVPMVYYDSNHWSVTERFCQRHKLPALFIPPNVERNTNVFTTLAKAVVLVRSLYPEDLIFFIGDRDVGVRTNYTAKHLLSWEGKVLDMMDKNNKVVFVQEEEGYMYFGDRYNGN